MAGKDGEMKMTTHMTAHSLQDAWSKADEIFPTDYELDFDACKNVGYDIWRSTFPGCEAWISNLGSRLEINLDDGTTVNVWIEEEQTAEDNAETINAETVAEWTAATRTAKSMTLEALFMPEVCQRVTLCIDGNYGNESEKRIYEAIKSGHPSILFDLLTRYAETHGIKWTHIWGCKADHYDHGKTGRGHYIVSGYISEEGGMDV